MVVYQYPAVSVLELDVDLAQAEEGVLFLLGALGNFGLDQGRFFLALSCLGSCGRLSEAGLNGGLTREEAGCSVALFLEVVDQVGALVVQFLEWPGVQALYRQHVAVSWGGGLVEAGGLELGLKRHHETGAGLHPGFLVGAIYAAVAGRDRLWRHGPGDLPNKGRANGVHAV